MGYSIKKRGAFAFSLWIGLLSAAISFILFVFFSSGWWVWWVTGLLPFLSFFLSYFRLKLSTLQFTDSEILYSRGIMMKTTQRIAFSNVTGTSRITTPVQSILGISILVIYTSGAFIPLFSLSTKDAKQLSAFLMEKGVVL